MGAALCPPSRSRNGARLLNFVLPLALATMIAAPGAAGAKSWRWTCAGPDFKAAGTFMTTDQPDARGFYAITAVMGEANGVAITGMLPAGTAIPGNDGWPVDNLVRADKPELGNGGFGVALADGTYANPFYGARFEPPGFLAVVTNPARGEWREPRVEFEATDIR